MKARKSPLGGIAELYMSLRCEPFRWTWELIAESTDLQILLAILGQHRIGMAARLAAEGKEYSPYPKQGVGVTDLTPEEEANLDQDELKKGFFNYGHSTLRIPRDAQGIAWLEEKWQEGLRRKQDGTASSTVNSLGSL